MAILQQLPTATVRVAQSAVLNFEAQGMLSAAPNIPFTLTPCEPTAEKWETLRDQQLFCRVPLLAWNSPHRYQASAANGRVSLPLRNETRVQNNIIGMPMSQIAHGVHRSVHRCRVK